MNTPQTFNLKSNNNIVSSRNTGNDFGRKQLYKDPFIGKSTEIKKIKEYHDESYY
jgi:hypothetical protein